MIVSQYPTDYISSFVVCAYLGVSHEWVLKWVLLILPASMRDMVIPADDNQSFLIHPDLFLTADYELKGVLH